MKATYLSLLAICICFSFSYAQEAGTSDLTLSTAPSDNLFDITLSALSSSNTQESKISGNILTSLKIDPITGRVSEIEFTGGSLNAADVSFSLAFGLATASSSGLGGVLSTPTPPGMVTPANGEFPGTEHLLTFNQGSISGSALGEPFTEDFSTSPVEISGSGTGTISLTETNRTATRILYDVALEFPISDTSMIDQGGIAVNLEVDGTITASGSTFVFLSPYLEWTETNTTPGAPFAENFAPGDWANGLVWAMRSSRKPWTQTNTGSWSLELPSEGTRGELRVEQSTTLDDWIPADAAQVVGGNISFPAGSTGSVEVIPQDTLRFFRVIAIEPK